MGQITQEEITGWMGEAISLMRKVPMGWDRFADKGEKIIAALQAAEPVAYLRKDQLHQIKTRGPAVGEIAAEPRSDRIAVYALPCPPAGASLSDAEINEITMGALGKWPSFEAQSWACEVVKAVLTAMAQPAKAQVPDEQVAFEEWARTDPLLGEHELDRNPEDSDDYDNLFTQAAWNAWQARAMLTASPAPEHSRDDNKKDIAVEYAYCAGFHDGHSQGLSCGHPLDPRCNEIQECDEAWAEFRQQEEAELCLTKSLKT